MESLLGGALWLKALSQKTPFGNWKSIFLPWSGLTILEDLSLPLLSPDSGILCPSGILGESMPGQLVLIMLPLGELCLGSNVLASGGVATSATMGSLVHRGRRPDSRYSTSSPGCGWVWAEGLRRSLEVKDQRRGKTLLSVSLGLVGDLILTLLP